VPPVFEGGPAAVAGAAAAAGAGESASASAAAVAPTPASTAREPRLEDGIVVNAAGATEAEGAVGTVTVGAGTSAAAGSARDLRAAEAARPVCRGGLPIPSRPALDAPTDAAGTRAAAHALRRAGAWLALRGVAAATTTATGHDHAQEGVQRRTDVRPAAATPAGRSHDETGLRLVAAVRPAVEPAGAADARAQEVRPRAAFAAHHDCERLARRHVEGRGCVGARTAGDSGRRATLAASPTLSAVRVNLDEHDPGRNRPGLTGARVAERDGVRNGEGGRRVGRNGQRRRIRRR
jgi:hypothetical protein